ncbi:LD-carboxypeptidase [Lysinibacillus agricola]|uniref:LD-carboxypeptidase n=1 Tax=Lysinibacillus agricola TaxID=2590012 RepID=A0ABX7AWZ0_9BACI|nr:MULTISPECIES: LD-carboxypeptidase [Lysinibacillus]KOS64220.1 peptidase S66 [Lysinibacillus sp. FJAT-14222]QQP14331.1 LD-carboxypeptidase [Lysinibacillus agricola]
MIRPKALKKGDTIGLISASGATPPEKFVPAVESIEKLGFKVVAGETCRARHGYLAGSDELRASEVNQMFRDSNIDGIFCIRGGYGATKILPLLDFDMIKANPKVFAGYSDVTALHIAFNQKCGFVTYHTPMPSTEFIRPEMDHYTWNSFIENVTATERSDYYLENPPGRPMTTLAAGKATGQLIGGNLTLVTASLGTPYEIDTKGKILFLEDVDENEQRVDRMLTQLKLAGKLDEVAGILLGAWTNCGPENPKHPEHSLSLQTIFQEILGPLHKPIIKDIACGHTLPTMSLPLGRTITMDAENQMIKVIE